MVHTGRMASEKQEQLELEAGERIVWSSPAQLSSAIGARPGSFVKTNRRLVFLPRKVALSKAPSWSSLVADIQAVSVIPQWRLPFAGIARPNRVRIASASGDAVVFFPDPAMAVAALSK
ncbi:MAG: hypothetical protein JWO63_2576 [Frankiales bacterium]|jgi:hypothetical protein|nr:hypothetical protein [Frankiales bacterium]